jgi:hypothetical protein
MRLDTAHGMGTRVTRLPGNQLLPLAVHGMQVCVANSGCNPGSGRCQSINQLHVCLAREEPKKGAAPKPPLVIPNRQVQTHKLGPDAAKNHQRTSTRPARSLNQWSP